MRAFQENTSTHPLDSMADSMSYPPTAQHFLPQYYPPAHPHHGHVHVVAPPSRPETAQRKRPKYTRSKTGCLTCRIKKIKCDETKPNCMRCAQGQRDCTWPEGVPARKKSASKKDSLDGRPSTAGSSELSESSTPPTRDHTPPRRLTNEAGIPPLASRRLSDPYLHLHSMSPETDLTRRSSGSAYSSLHQAASNAVFSMIPEISPYGVQTRYDAYPSVHSSSRSFQPLSNGARLGHHSPVAHWTSSMIGSLDPIQPFVSHSGSIYSSHFT